MARRQSESNGFANDEASVLERLNLAVKLSEDGIPPHKNKLLTGFELPAYLTTGADNLDNTLDVWKQKTKIAPDQEWHMTITEVLNENDLNITQQKKKQDDGTSRLSCGICLDSLIILQKQGTPSVAITKCAHVFCEACVNDAMKTTNCCPKCRQKMDTKKPYTRLYF